MEAIEPEAVNSCQIEIYMTHNHRLAAHRVSRFTK